MTTVGGIVPELYCSDFERSLSFYTDLVGFSVAYQRAEDRFAYLRLHRNELMIEQTVDRDRMLVAGPLRHPYGRGMNLQIEVDDIDRILARFTPTSHVLFRPLEERWYRRGDVDVGVRQFVASDPDGYLLRFSEPLGPRA